MKERRVEVAIVGAGSAGLYALGQVRRAGKSFVLIDGGELGTTCARVGCMPSKAMIQIANDFSRRRQFARFGIAGHEDLQIDLPEALEYVQDLRDTFVDRVLSNSTDQMGDELIEANARFVEPGVLEAGEHRVFADRVIIATGSRPQIPPKWVEFGDRILTTDTLFDQESLPATMAVVGLGVIGLELGQALHRLGVEVTGVEMTETLGGVDDPSVREVAAEIFGKELELWLGRAAELSETENGQLSVSAGERSTVVDKVLVSAGRTPNVETLGLEQLGVAFDERGAPVHDRNTMQIGDLPVYLAGDVTGERPVLHEAGDEGRIAGYNAAADSVTGFRRKVPLSINFADPNVCTVGMRWSELDRDSTAVGEIRFAPVGRALIMGKNKGILRIYAEKANGRLLGAEMVAPKGENLAHLLAWSIQQGLGVIDLLRMPFYHPVIEEALQAALYDCYAKLDKRVRQVPVELIPL